ncbi:MAG: hypothetical protein DMG32_24925 [Acidobacteria bacterium]|nr:MAG: hypothetical protein DMG32_24925 [Acidobacteriota bacterium]
MTDKTKGFLKCAGLTLVVLILYLALFASIIPQASDQPAVPILAVAATAVTVFVALRLAKKFNR